MTTYKEIFGKQIKQVSSDPTSSEVEGQIWFNTTAGAFKTVLAVAAWSSGGNLNTARHNGAVSGTKTAGLYAGGKVYPNSFQNASEEYNGTSWTEGDNLGTARSNVVGAGTQTAGLAAGGTNGAPGSSGVQTATEEYGGTSWTAGGALSTARMNSSGAGLQTAAFLAGGIGSPNSLVTTVENYNGSSWTSGTAMPGERSNSGSAGTQTAGLVFGGYVPPSYAFATSTIEYDGEGWTAGGNLSVARQSLGGFGAQTNAIAFGGTTPPNNNSGATEGYDGTSWSTKPALATSRTGFSPSGSYNSGTDGFAAGGSQAGNPMNAQTEEFSMTIFSPIAATWASGANYPTGTNQLGGSGTQTAGLGFGGNTTGGNPNGSNVTAEYNGSSWTSGGNLATARNTGSRSGLGTQTATMCINFRNDGTATPSFPIPPSNNNYRAQTEVEEYNGSSWTAGTATPDGEVEAGTCGTISAALRFGGNPGNPPGGPASNGTLYWNDSSWTSLNNMSSGRYGLAPAFQGTYNAALAFGGQTPAPANVTSTEEFDGTNWTAGGSLNTAVFRGSGSGTQTAALSFGGSPNVTATEGYDGTAWSTRPSLANGRSFGGGAGSNTAALYIAGDEGVHVEEFTGEIPVLDYKTLTSS